MNGIELGKKLREISYQTLLIYVSGYERYRKMTDFFLVILINFFALYTTLQYLSVLKEKERLVKIFMEQVVDFDPQPVITKDNVTMLIDTVVLCRQIWLLLLVH